jgi:tape measure domain-containing protein
MGEAEISRLLVRLVGDGSAYQQMLSTAQAATRSFASTTAGILGSVGLSFGLISTAIKGVQAAAASEARLIDIEVLLGSAEKAKKLIADVAAFSERTPLRMGPLLDASKMFAQVGVEAGDIVPILKLLGDATGGNSEKFDSMALTMQHVLSQGTATRREIRSLTFAGFNPLSEVAKMTGKSVAQLTQEMHKGGIGADMIIRAFQHAGAAGGIFSGRTEKMSQTLKGLFTTMQDNVGKVVKAIGEVLVEGLDLKTVVRNVTEGAKVIVGWLKSISPEAKRVIAIVLSVVAGVGVLSFALFALGPVFGLLGTVLGPVVALLGMIPALFGFLISPIGIVTVAIAALTGVVLYFSGAGGMVLDWFAKQWASLKESVMPAIQGIKDALAARDFQLAFEIAWAQIKLTFTQATKGLREMWVGFTVILKETWVNATAFIEDVWERTTTAVAKGLAGALVVAGVYSQQQFNDIQANLTGDMEANLKQIEKDRKAGLAAAQSDAQKSMQAIQDDLKNKLKERDELVAKAAAEAAAAGGTPVPLIPEIDPDKFKQALPPQKLHVTPVMHWEAALAESAEAVARIATYADMLAGVPGAGLGARGHRAEGTAPGGGILAEPAGLGLGNVTPVPVPVQAGPAPAAVDLSPVVAALGALLDELRAFHADARRGAPLPANFT